MPAPWPQLPLSGEQIAHLTAQLLIYQQYLQRKVAPSAKRNQTLQVLRALLQRLATLFDPMTSQGLILLTVEEVAMITESLAVLRNVLQTRPPSVGRDDQLQRLTNMQALIEQTFPNTHD